MNAATNSVGGTVVEHLRLVDLLQPSVAHHRHAVA